ncbi:MAG TPA: hypothetical protein VKE96_03930 [Vicinamibacterales bacterium]|nr:hypothetical protein [Vicinamibacterales bacterium]
MKRVRLLLVVAGVIGVLAISSTAGADGFFVPWRTSFGVVLR